jgi:phage terminase large subunit-like protein
MIETENRQSIFEARLLDSQYDEELRLLNAIGIELANRAQKIDFYLYRPNKKHMEFFEKGKDYVERCFTACNQGGKSWSGAYEDICHLTGLYPDWWPGYRFTGPVEAAVIGNTARQMRGTIQKILLGSPGQWGTGMLPKEFLLEEPKTAKGVSGAVDYFQVRHVSGGVSSCYLVSSESGWRALQGFTLHFIHLDEEPVKSEAFELYSELVPRLIKNKGIMYMTATPQQGMTDIMSFYFLDDDDPMDMSDIAVLRREGSAWRTLIRMTIDDIDHWDDEQRARFRALCPPSKQRSRLYGFPEQGEGKVWDYPEGKIFCEPFDVRRDGFKFIRGVDSGYKNSYFACVELCYDPSTGTLYLYECFKVRHTLVSDLARELLARDDAVGISIPTAWPRDISREDISSAMVPVEEFRKKGVAMTKEAAEFDDDRQNHVGPGLYLIDELLQTNKLKILRSPRTSSWKKEWEYFSYGDDGKVLKGKNRQNDLMDATRYAGIAWYRGWAKARQGKAWQNQPSFSLAGI